MRVETYALKNSGYFDDDSLKLTLPEDAEFKLYRLQNPWTPEIKLVVVSNKNDNLVRWKINTIWAFTAKPFILPEGSVFIGYEDKKYFIARRID